MISLPAKVKISMNALRIAVLCAFVLSVIVTIWSMQAAQSITCDMQEHQSHEAHILHVAHVALISLTFLLIALYLLKSAEIASLAAHREMRLRLTVDMSAEFIEHVPSGPPILNVCVGVLAKKGIFVRSARAMVTLSKLKTLAVSGNSEAREGYLITKTTLADMGVELIGSSESCPLKLKLGAFYPEDAYDNDFVFTNDKITHVLAAVYVCRVYARFLKYAWILLLCMLAAAAALLLFGQYTYAGAVIAFWAASGVLIVRQIERRTMRLTFKRISNS